MPRVSVERLRSEVSKLLRRVDVNAMSQGAARNQLEVALGLEEGGLLDDKELVKLLLRDALVLQETRPHAHDDPGLVLEAQRTVEVQVEAELGDGRQQVWTHRLTLDTEQLLRLHSLSYWFAPLNL
eukprot:s91_g14.t1